MGQPVTTRSRVFHQDPVQSPALSKNCADDQLTGSEGPLPSMPACLLEARWRTGLIAALVALVYVTCVPLSNGDIREHLLHWTAYLIEHGRFDALGETFSEYAPPYLYLLSLGTLLAPFVGQLASIKMVSIAGTVFLACCMRGLLATCVDAPAARRGGLLTLCLPTVVANGPAWGQCDALYAGCALLAIAAAARGHVLAMMVAAGVALSFKLQAVFVGPLLLATLLAGRGRWWTLVLLPITYAMLMLPAWIAGRPIRDLALLYLAQGAYFHDLARSVPNIWQVLRAIAPRLPYGPGVAVGLTLAAGAVLLIGVTARRALEDPRRVVLVALTGAILVPYLLPKMHNRYFFLADVLGFAYAFSQPSRRSIWIALLIQVASLLAYATFLLHLTGGAFVGAFVMTAALVLVVREFGEKVAPLHEGWRLPFSAQERRVAAGATHRAPNSAT
jgi:Gpi18-like mannosyltransferase